MVEFVKIATAIGINPCDIVQEIERHISKPKLEGRTMNGREVLDSASLHLQSLAGHVFDLLTISKPISPAAAVNLAKVVSKLSPLLGNLIEFNTVEFLNDQPEYKELGEWKRQDPGFPDTIFVGSVSPVPGFEIKAWFPLATEITARFKDSQNHFKDDQTNVCLLAWLPDQLIFGKPKIMDVCVVSGRSVAEARDVHYHNPPDYIVLEPGNTKARTRNLQQTNTNGFKWQGTPAESHQAERVAAKLGAGKRKPISPQQSIRFICASSSPISLTGSIRILQRSIEKSTAELRILNGVFQARQFTA